MKIKTKNNEYDLQDAEIIKKLPENPTDKDIAKAILHEEKPRKDSPVVEPGDYNYTVLGHFNNDDLVYNLMFEKDGVVHNFPMKSEFYVKTIKGEQSLHTPCEGKSACGNSSGISRLYSIEGKEKINKDWLNFEGRTLDNQYYKKLYSGKVNVKEGVSTELQMSGDLDGRWLMRKIPNVFNKESKDCTLFWKPETNDVKLVEEKLFSEQAFPIEQIGNMVMGTVLAEGTWQGKQKTTWTRESIKSYYDQLQHKMNTEDYKIPLNLEHDSKNIVGYIDKIKFSKTGGIYRILGSGYTTIDKSQYTGLSVHFTHEKHYEIKAYDTKIVDSEQKVDFNHFQVALVQKPACTICHTI